MTRTIGLTPAAERRSALATLIAEDAAGGPVHGSEICHASLVRRALAGQPEGVLGLLVRDSLGTAPAAFMPLSDSDLAEVLATLNALEI